jgi:hypothetical protein
MDNGVFFRKKMKEITNLNYVKTENIIIESCDKSEQAKTNWTSVIDSMMFKKAINKNLIFVDYKTKYTLKITKIKYLEKCSEVQIYDLKQNYTGFNGTEIKQDFVIEAVIFDNDSNNNQTLVVPMSLQLEPSTDAVFDFFIANNDGKSDRIKIFRNTLNIFIDSIIGFIKKNEKNNSHQN